MWPVIRTVTSSTALLLALVVAVVVVVAIIVPVVVTVTVPVMVVRDPAAIAVPIAVIVALSVMMRCNPARAVVRWTCPVSVMPLITISHRVPVARNPRISFTWTSWLISKFTYRWRRADSYADGKLGKDGPRSQQHQYN
jgi:hypothetical protein